MIGWLRRRFAKQRDAAASVASLHTDLHSHLLVGLDDGAATDEEALSMIRGLADLGFRKAVTTPHVYHDLYNNTAENIRQGFARLQGLLQEHRISFTVQVAAEYFLDEHFIRLIESEPLLTFGSNYVLFELPYHNRPIMLDEVIFRLNLAGYQPVLAHPERYLYLYDRKLNQFADLKKAGVLLQLNLAALNGHYGSGPRRAALALSKAGLYDFAGTDLHQAAACSQLQQVINSEAYRLLLATNPLRNNEL